MDRDWYTVADLIARLSKLPQDAQVLLQLGVHDSIAALDDTWGLPGNFQTVGANCVLEYDECHVYILHATFSDFDTPPTRKAVDDGPD